MSQALNIVKELPHEDLRIVIKGELQKIYNKHYKHYNNLTIYKLRLNSGRFILNIHLGHCSSTTSCLSAREANDDFCDLFRRLYRISPSIEIKLFGSPIIKSLYQ
jgi:hypothetical protein